jgi:hypothetical protein
MKNNPLNWLGFRRVFNFLFFSFVFLAVFIISTRVFETKALESGSISNSTVVTCDPYSGCFVESGTDTGEFEIVQFFQRNYTGMLKGSCNKTVAEAGCAITSAAMIATEFLESQTSQITPTDVNNKMTGTCVFSPEQFASKYSLILSYDVLISKDTATTKYTNLSILSNYIAPFINENSLAIIGGYGPSGTHFVVVNGYFYYYELYENDSYINYLDLEIVDPSIVNRDKLSNFMVTYPTIHKIWFFKDKV